MNNYFLLSSTINGIQKKYKHIPWVVVVVAFGKEGGDSNDLF